MEVQFYFEGVAHCENRPKKLKKYTIKKQVGTICSNIVKRETEACQTLIYSTDQVNHMLKSPPSRTVMKRHNCKPNGYAKVDRNKRIIMHLKDIQSDLGAKYFKIIP